MKTGNQIFLEKFNKAFANNDSEYILEHVTDDIRWEIVGDSIVEGKDVFAAVLKEMEQDEPLNMTIHHIITHGRHASVNGVMKMPNGKSYGFCDVVKFSGFKNPRVKEMTSYSIELLD